MLSASISLICSCSFLLEEGWVLDFYQAAHVEPGLQNNRLKAVLMGMIRETSRTAVSDAWSLFLGLEQLDQRTEVPLKTEF